jgi:hypothetical protein
MNVLRGVFGVERPNIYRAAALRLLTFAAAAWGIHGTVEMGFGYADLHTRYVGLQRVRSRLLPQPWVNCLPPRRSNALRPGDDATARQRPEAIVSPYAVMGNEPLPTYLS